MLVLSIEEVEVFSSQDAEVDEDVEQTGTSIWNHYQIDGVQSKRGGAKNITCTFVILLSLGALRLELLLIFLVEQF
jgi:hypothetical protein